MSNLWKLKYEDLVTMHQEAMSNDDEELQYALEDELNARDRDESDPAVIGERQHREDYGV